MTRMIFARTFRVLLLLTLVSAVIPLSASAQPAPFAGGWTLDSEASSLAFLSIKDMTKVESSIPR